MWPYTGDLYQYDESTEEMANNPGPDTAKHLAQVGEGYISGEIPMLFQTVHDATMVAGARGCRLWHGSLHIAIARHVIGCRLSRDASVQNACR